MPRRGFIRRVEQNYAGDIAKLFGIPQQNLTFNVVKGLTRNSEDGRLAQAANGVIDIDRKFLRRGDPRDVRGALIHEMTHAMGPGMDGKRAETFADYARYTLNKNEFSEWKPSAEVLAMAERRGTGMAGQPNGPRQGRNGGHKRNAGTNQRSKNGGYLPSGAPPLGPAQSQAFTAQMAALQNSYSNALAAIRAQGGEIRGQYQSGLADIKANRIAGTAETEGAALSRGIVGSSADLGGRAAVVAEASGARVDARMARNSALSALRVSEMQAGTDYQMGIAQVAADKAAAQAELANQRFEQDMLAQQQDTYQSWLKKILARGKNPNGVDPRAGTPDSQGSTEPIAPYGGQYSGKYIRPGLFDGIPGAVPTTDLFSPYGGLYSGKLVRG